MGRCMLLLGKVSSSSTELWTVWCEYCVVSLPVRQQMKRIRREDPAAAARDILEESEPEIEQELKDLGTL